MKRKAAIHENSFSSELVVTSEINKKVRNVIYLFIILGILVILAIYITIVRFNFSNENKNQSDKYYKKVSIYERAQ